jgi:hypothetical protein
VHGAEGFRLYGGRLRRRTAGNDEYRDKRRQAAAHLTLYIFCTNVVVSGPMPLISIIASVLAIA